MAETTNRAERIRNPRSHYDNPAAIMADKELSQGEKTQALDTWEQDARQLLTASGEGMPGPEEGENRHDAHRLGEVVRTKVAAGREPKHKPSH